MGTIFFLLRPASLAIALGLALLLTNLEPVMAQNFAPKSALPRASAVLAGMTALSRFNQSALDQKKPLGASLIGFYASISDEGGKTRSEVQIYRSTAEANAVQDYQYQCLINADRNDQNAVVAACQYVSLSAPRAYRPAPGEFGLEEFRLASETSLQLFERAFGNPAKITQAKLWRSSAERGPVIHVTYTWMNYSLQKQVNHFYCHHHEPEFGQNADPATNQKFDCHRLRAPGTHEP